MNNANTNTTSQYLTFKLDAEEFAIDILQVREVLDFTTVTKVPRTPDYMSGVINLRGSVVPVIDLRVKFGMPKIEKTVNTCIVIAEMIIENEPIIIGALADSVQEVMEMAPEDIEAAPTIGTRLDIEFIKGMGKRDDKFIVILDIEKVFSSDEIALVQKTSADLVEEEVLTA